MSQKKCSQHILVVDDDVSLRRFNKKVLSRQGYSVDLAEDGAAACDLLAVRGYDLVITDYDMPKVSGVQLIKKIRDRQLDVPVIMATGSFPAKEFELNPGLEPDATLLKPYTIDEMLRAVNGVLRTPRGPRHRAQPAPAKLEFIVERTP